MTRWLCVLACLGPVPSGFAETCAPITGARKAALVRYVQRKYRLATEARLTISEISEVGGGCYRKLRFEDAGQSSHFDVSFYLTPDQRFLVTELNDSTGDPVAEEQSRFRARRQALEDDNGVASFGPANAPVTIVVFSDFQCPYCKRLADTLKQIVLQEKQVRLLFRNMPLDSHPWAELAAEMAACVQLQDGAAFWRVHDYLFEHQRELRPENVQRQLMVYVGSLPHVRAELVRDCLNRKRRLPQLQKDLALGRANNVRGTPTVFVNGSLVNGGAPTKEHLLTLIREAENEVALGGSGRSGTQHR